MRKSLREIAQEPTSRRIILLRKQPHVVPHSQNPIEDFTGFFHPALQCQVVGEP
jgi:hypothetical protein